MKPKEIKAAMQKTGVLNIYGGTKWETHYDPGRASYTTLGRNTRCSIFETDEDGFLRMTGTCDCHHGEYLRKPAPWLNALLALLDKCQEDEDHLEAVAARVVAARERDNA